MAKLLYAPHLGCGVERHGGWTPSGRTIFIFMKKKAIAITLAGKKFHSKIRCRNFIRWILNNTENKIINSQEFDIILALLNKHPRAKQKIGCGVLYFATRKSPCRRGQKYFIIHREDGSEEDFSFYKCLNWGINRKSLLDNFQ